MDSSFSPASHFLGASPLLQASEIGTPDMSFSELSLSEIPRNAAPRFSIFAESPDPSARHVSYDENPVEEEDIEEDGGDATFLVSRRTQDAYNNAEGYQIDQDETQIQLVASTREREDKLRAALVTLRKLNTVFTGYVEALREADDKHRRLAAKVSQTNQLLDQYVAILGQSEHTARLLLDRNWQGASVDEELAEQERIAAEEQARREVAEREAKARAEQEKKAREEQEHLLRKETTQEDKQNLAKGSIRGGRGRGRLVRNIPAYTASRGRVPSSSVAGGGTKRPVSGSIRSTTFGRAPTSGRLS